MVNLKYFLLISAIVLFIVAFYRWLMRHLRRNDINIPFAFLFPFNNKGVFRGVETIKLDLPIDAKVRTEIIKVNGELATLAFEKNFKKGIHICEIDVSGLEIGTYTLRVVMPDQTITRFIEVIN